MTGRASTPSATPTATAAALALTWIASAAGLLWLPLDLYDEPALALGGRIVRAGGLPYVDFYTHYGPLGYSLMACFLSLGNPGIAFRTAQAVALGVVALPLVPLSRGIRTGRILTALLSSSVLLLLSAGTVFSNFFAFALVVLAAELAALGELSPDARKVGLGWLGAGAAAGLAALVRPAFGAYASAALIGFALATRGRGPSGRVGRFVLGAIAAAGLAWLLLYPRIPLSDAWFATVVVPSRLTGGTARFLATALLPPRVGPQAQSVFGSFFLAALFLLSTVAAVRAPDRKARAAVAAGALAALAAPGVLAGTRSPGQAASVAAVLLLAAAVASFVFAAPSLAVQAATRISALAGLAAVAFFHYFLTRGDQSHATAALALAATAAIAALPVLSRPGRLAVAVLLAVVIVPTVTGAPPYPLYWLGRRTTTGSVSTATGVFSRLPASAFPAQAVAAVSAADRGASPESRFVALATDHSRTEGSAIVLFLLSTRLPYTRWYAYDPGVQSSALVQEHMMEELEKSGSATAVTWRSESFAGIPETDPPRTALDRKLRELYPRVRDRFGGLEVREAR